VRNSSLLVIQITIFILLLNPFSPLYEVKTAQALPDDLDPESLYFRTITPGRLYDSRACPGTPPGRDGYIYAGQTRPIYGINNGFGIPNNAVAILANVTVSAQRSGDCTPSGAALGSGRITAFPHNGSNSAGTVSVNWWSGGPWHIANYNIIGLDSAGYFKVESTGTTDFIIDVFGYLIKGDNSNSGYFRTLASNQNRLYDSRPVGTNVPNPPQGVGAGRFGVGMSDRTIYVRGYFNIPNTAKAAIVNVTASDTNGGGYFGLYPSGTGWGGISSVNWNNRYAGNIPWDVPNLAIVPIGSDGAFKVTVGGGSAQLIIDVIGYIDSTTDLIVNGHYTVLKNPQRLYDTRIEGGQISGHNAERIIQLRGRAGVPVGVQSVVIHVTSQDVGGGGHLALFNAAKVYPGISNVNMNGSNQLTGGTTIVPLDKDGRMKIRNGTPGPSTPSPKGFVLDLVGYVLEIDYPGCRWIHNIGVTTYLRYFWGENLQGSSAWRTAFEAGISDWNNLPNTKIFYASNFGDGAVTIDTVWDTVNQGAGFARSSCSGTNTASYYVVANTYSTAGYSDNQRRSVATHELGHSFSLGHLSNVASIEGAALLGENPNGEIYYTPQPLDVDLVQRVYP
jgi:Dual-action HEIGH metallo-peptidase